MLRTSVFKFLQISTVALLILVFTLSAAGVRSAQAATDAQITDGWMPFAGSFYDMQTNSIINFNGLVHIVARWQSLSSGQVQVDISANLPATGVSVTTDTGIPFSAFGAGQSSILFPTDPTYPTDPLRVTVPSFWLVTVGSDRPLPPNPILPPSPILPPNPIRPLNFAMRFDLVFSAAGVLDLIASTVQVTQVPDIDGG